MTADLASSWQKALRARVPHARVVLARRLAEGIETDRHRTASLGDYDPRGVSFARRCAEAPPDRQPVAQLTIEAVALRERSACRCWLSAGRGRVRLRCWLGPQTMFRHVGPFDPQ